MTSLSRFSVADLFFVVACAFALAFWQQASVLSPPFDAYPKLVSGGLAFLSTACIIREKIRPSKTTTSLSFQGFAKTTLTILGIGLYIVCIAKIGYFVSSFIYLVTMLQIGKFGRPDQFLETKPLITDSFVAIAITGSIAIVFKFGLNLVFPDAWLF